MLTRKSEENWDEEKTQNIRAKNKRAGKRATTGNQSLSKTQKRGHSLRDQSITRHVSVYSLRRFLSLSLRSRVWSGSKPKRVQAGRKTSRLKIRKNHALRLRDWARVRAPRGDDANVKTYKKPPQTHLQFPLVLLLHHYRYLEQWHVRATWWNVALERLNFEASE